MAPSVKHKSRSAFNTIANSSKNLPLNPDGTIQSLKNGRKPGQMNRCHTVLPENDKCNVQFVLFCEPHSKKWYLSAPKKLIFMKSDANIIISKSCHPIYVQHPKICLIM